MPAVINAGNVALGVGSLYTAPMDTARPTDALIVNDAIAAPWTFVGATHQGATMTYDQTVQEIRIEEQSLPVRRLKIETKFNLTLALSEDTMSNIALAYSANLAVIAAGIAGSGTAAKTRISLQDTLALSAILFRMLNSFGVPRTLYIPRVVQGGNVATPLRRVAEQRVYPITLEATPLNTSDVALDDYGSVLPVTIP